MWFHNDFSNKNDIQGFLSLKNIVENIKFIIFIFHTKFLSKIRIDY